jgi:hypothetical protein
MSPITVIPAIFARTRSIALALGLGLVLAACSTAAAVPPSATIPSATATPAPTPANLQVAEADNGHTVTVAVGSQITLVLGSTYWQVGDTAAPAILGLASGPTTSAAPMGTCVPGGGCGTVTAVFHALSPGTAQIVASRTTCGEAMLCTGTDGAYEVTVVVTP